MKATKTMLSFFSASVLLLISACGEQPASIPAESGSAAVQETEPAETEPAILDALPAGLDFGGASFAFYAPTASGCSTLVQGETGDILNDTTYRIQKDVEERLNVVISEKATELYHDEALTEAKAMIMAGDTSYQCYGMLDRFALSAAEEGYFRNLTEIPYIDLTREYWGGSLMDAYRIKGKQYFSAGSYNLKTYQYTAAVFYNQVIGTSLDMDSPVTWVDDGTWTFDRLFALRSAATADLNGDGVMDNADRYTFCSPGKVYTTPQLLNAADVYIIEKNGEGLPVITVYDGNQRMYDVMESVYRLLYEGTDMTEEYTMFPSDQALFFFGLIANMGTFRNMESEYVILPPPKWNAEQETYSCRVYDPVFHMIPVTVSEEEEELCGAVLEALNAEGYRDLVPTYVQTVLQEKYAHNEDTQRMIRLCFDHQRIELAEILNNYFGDSAIDAVVKKGPGNFASAFAKKQKGAEKELQKLIDMILELD